MYAAIRNFRIGSGSPVALLWIMSIFLTFEAENTMANPQGGKVVRGQVSISNKGKRLVVNQSSHKAVIDWRNFNISHGEHTQFNQPSTSAVALNRVRGGQLSQINGRLSANGQIFLINPNGVIFGSNAQVAVGGLVATTADLRNNDFMAGNYHFNQASANPNASVNNLGQITVNEGGAVVLAAPSVSNEGLIQARLGNVKLASVDTYTLDFHGDGLLSFEIEGQVTQQPDSVANDSALVNNSGTIIADGGTVTLTAQAADAVIDRVINMDGIIQAKSLVKEQGEIVLSGGNHGIVDVSGTLDVSGAEVGQTGGNVKVLGEKVGLFDRTQILANGYAGGGEVLVGGNFQGKGSELNAKRTYVGKNSEINASATETGDGGSVIVWADETTRFFGDIDARGGVQEGDGGFVEVSGKQNLDFQGTVSVSAPKGSSGSVLLDPDNITISDATPQDQDSLVSPADGEIFFNDLDFVVDSTAPPIIDFELSNDALEAVDGNVTLEANENIVIDAALNLVNQSSGESVVFRAREDIQINADITTNGADLTLEADSQRAVNTEPGNIVISDATISTNGGTLDMSGGTTLSNNVTFNSDGGSIFLNMIDGTPGGTDETLTVDAGSGGILLNDIGVSEPLGAVTANGASIVIDNVFTRGPQSYTGSVEMSSSFNTGGGAFIVMGDTVIGGDTTIITGGGRISFEDAIDQFEFPGSDFPVNFLLDLDASPNGPIDLLGTVGTNFPLGEVIVTGSTISLGGVTTVEDQFSTPPTSGNQQYNGAVTLNNNYNTGGGSFIINGNTTLESDTTVSTAGGDIQFGNIGGNATNSLVLNADSDLGSAGQITLNGINQPLLLNNPRNDLVGTLNINATGSNNIEIADKNLLQLGNSTIGSGQFTIAAGDLNIVGTLNTTGGGSLIMRPIDLTQDIGIGDGIGTFNLTQSEIDNISNGFSSITLGSPGFAGVVDIDHAIFRDPFIVQADGSGAAIIVNGELTGIIDASITLNGSGETTFLNGNIITEGKPIIINDAVILKSSVLLDTTAGGFPGAGITFGGTVNGDTTFIPLTLRAGTGNIVFQGNVGNIIRLGNVSVESANDINMNRQFRVGDTRLIYSGFWRNNINFPLDVGNLFVIPFAQGAKVYGRVAGFGDIFASEIVTGVKGDPRFTINDCTMGVACRIPEKSTFPSNNNTFPSNINTLNLPLNFDPLTLGGFELISVWEQQKILQDPRDERYSNLGNEELWWEINREIPMGQQ